jgi:hypothetical protein
VTYIYIHTYVDTLILEAQEINLWKYDVNSGLTQYSLRSKFRGIRKNNWGSIYGQRILYVCIKISTWKSIVQLIYANEKTNEASLHSGVEIYIHESDVVIFSETYLGFCWHFNILGHLSTFLETIGMESRSLC